MSDRPLKYCSLCKTRSTDWLRAKYPAKRTSNVYGVCFLNVGALGDSLLEFPHIVCRTCIAKIIHWTEVIIFIWTRRAEIPDYLRPAFTTILGTRSSNTTYPRKIVDGLPCNVRKKVCKQLLDIKIICAGCSKEIVIDYNTTPKRLESLPFQCSNCVQAIGRLTL